MGCIGKKMPGFSQALIVSRFNLFQVVIYFLHILILFQVIYEF